MVAALFPLQGLAQLRLDRLETLSEEITAVVYARMVEELAATGADSAALAEAMPDPSWDDAFRDAGQCMLEAYDAEASAEAVDRMLSDMEDVLPRIAGASLEEMEELGSFLPAGLTESDSLRINQQCGMMDLQRERMMQSGFMEAMMAATQGG